MLTFLANVAPAGATADGDGEVGIEVKILQSNPLLEALGNAKTLRNGAFSLSGLSVWLSLSELTRDGSHVRCLSS